MVENRAEKEKRRGPDAWRGEKPREVPLNSEGSVLLFLIYFHSGSPPSCGPFCVPVLLQKIRCLKMPSLSGSLPPFAICLKLLQDLGFTPQPS